MMKAATTLTWFIPLCYNNNKTKTKRYYHISYGLQTIKASILQGPMSSFYARSQSCEKWLLASSCLSVRPSAWNNSAPTRRIFMKFNIWVFFENLSRKFQFHYNLTRITGTLHEDQYTFLIIFRSILLRERNVSDKSCIEKQHTFHVQ